MNVSGVGQNVNLSAYRAGGRASAAQKKKDIVALSEAKSQQERSISMIKASNDMLKQDAEMVGQLVNLFA